MEDLKNKVITFEEFKEDLLQKAKDADACDEGYTDAVDCITKKDLLRVIKNYISWCLSNKVVSVESLTAVYSEEELIAENIYISGRREVKDVFAVALGNSTVKALGNSTVEALDNSTVKALGNSTVEAWDNSTVEALGNSTVKALDNSTVKALDNSTVKAWDNSTVEAWDNSYTLFYNSRKKHTLSDSAILKDYYKNKIYIKKSSHEIIEVE